MRWLLVLVTAVVACSQPPKPPASGGGGGSAPAPSGDRDSCTSADDCTLVDQCCGCNAGGGKLAIRKDHAGAFEAQRHKECGDMVCPAVISNDPSCMAVAICSGGTCTVAPHVQHE
jgi:hypothetical protein